MDSIRNLFKVGNGPSSSHTIGPKKAATIFLNKNKDTGANRFVVELYGSLAATGRGHLTDVVIYEILGKERTKIQFFPKKFHKYHSNAMKFIAFDGKTLVDEWLVFSIGGGELRNADEKETTAPIIYEHKNMDEVLKYCKLNKISLYEYVLRQEGDSILEFASYIVDIMFKSVERGLHATGVLPGELKIKRRSNEMYVKYCETNEQDTLLFGATLAVSEENASGGVIVTAPTCGASGVFPGVMYTYFKTKKFSFEEIRNALLIAGIIGNFVKYNASISGAEVGCQGEVGTACSMTAASVCYLHEGTNEQIEYAAEIALEHFLGMTCDPIKGYVQIPCIERNAVSSKRAIDCANYALLSNGEHYVSLDSVIDTMNKTGRDLRKKYKETSKGGLASIKVNCYENCQL